MPTALTPKTILTSATLHVKDEKRSKPFKYDPQGVMISGKFVTIEVPPETAVKFLDGREADKIIARHGGEETDLAHQITVAPNPDDVEDDEIIPLAATKAGKKAGEPA